MPIKITGLGIDSMYSMRYNSDDRVNTDLGQVVKLIRHVDDTDICFWTFLSYVALHHPQVMRATPPDHIAETVNSLCSTLEFPPVEVLPSWRSAEAAKPAEEKCETPFGPFVKHEQHWHGYVDVEDREIAVIVRDVNGAPNQVLLDQLKVLPELEQTARRQVEQITGAYDLDLVMDGAEAGQLTLRFDWWEGESEFICVDFEGSVVVDWYRV